MTLTPCRTYTFALTLFVVVLFGAYITPFAYAQIGAVGGVTSLQLNPSYPGPGVEVLATLNAQSVNKPSARVTWYMDGRVVQEEYGNFTYRFTTGPVGSTVNLSVTVHLAEGGVFTQSIKRTIGSVSIIWEGRTYTPPFYAGRALHSPGAEVTLQAIPILSGASGLADPSKLVFSWRIGGETNPSKAGLGLDTITTKAFGPLSSLGVSVVVEDKLANVLAEKYITVPVTQPLIRFYEADPLMGIRYGNAFGRTSRLAGSESRIYAEPYYMSTNRRSDTPMIYEWLVGGTQKLSEPGSIVLRPSGEGSGSARIELTVRHSKVWQQNARGETTMLFDTVKTGVSSVETKPL